MCNGIVKSENWKQNLSRLNLSSELLWNQSLIKYNTLRVGGNTACLAEISNYDDLSTLLSFIEENKIPWFVIGNGSNILVTDKGWPGIIIHLSGEFKKYEIVSSKEIKVGAAFPDMLLARKCISHGLAGLEFLIGIPGNIGGAIATNAGCHGKEISNYLKNVHWLDTNGKKHISSRESLDFAYRYSPLNCKCNKIIIEATFCLEESDPISVERKIKEYQQIRGEKQPKNVPNCGSVFKNPKGDFAARMIESVGLKGYSIGNAQISPKHSNFIVNHGKTSSSDIIALIELVREKVWNKYGIVLELEIQLLIPSIHHARL